MPFNFRLFTSPGRVWTSQHLMIIARVDLHRALQFTQHLARHCEPNVTLWGFREELARSLPSTPTSSKFHGKDSHPDIAITFCLRAQDLRHLPEAQVEPYALGLGIGSMGSRWSPINPPSPWALGSKSSGPLGFSTVLLCLFLARA